MRPPPIVPKIHALSMHNHKLDSSCMNNALQGYKLQGPSSYTQALHTPFKPINRLVCMHDIERQAMDYSTDVTWLLSSAFFRPPSLGRAESTRSS